MNDADTYKDLLSKFDEINKNIVGNRTLREIKKIYTIQNLKDQRVVLVLILFQVDILEKGRCCLNLKIKRNMKMENALPRL